MSAQGSPGTWAISRTGNRSKWTKNSNLKEAYKVGEKLQKTKTIIPIFRERWETFTHKQYFKSPRITKWENQCRRSNIWITIPQRETIENKGRKSSERIFKNSKMKDQFPIRRVHLVPSGMNYIWSLSRSIIISQNNRNKIQKREKTD